MKPRASGSCTLLGPAAALWFRPQEAAKGFRSVYSIGGRCGTRQMMGACPSSRGPGWIARGSSALRYPHLSRPNSVTVSRAMSRALRKHRNSPLDGWLSRPSARTAPWSLPTGGSGHTGVGIDFGNTERRSALKSKLTPGFSLRSAAPFTTDYSLYNYTTRSVLNTSVVCKRLARLRFSRSRSVADAVTIHQRRVRGQSTRGFARTGTPCTVH